MFKVTIKSPTGEIIRESDNAKVGTFPNFKFSEYSKYPNSLHNITIILDTGAKVTLAYGGITQNGKFCETCHMKCKWGIHCLNYLRGNCEKSTKFKDVGFYIL